MIIFILNRLLFKNVLTHLQFLSWITEFRKRMKNFHVIFFNAFTFFRFVGFVFVYLIGDTETISKHWGFKNWECHFGKPWYRWFWLFLKHYGDFRYTYLQMSGKQKQNVIGSITIWSSQQSTKTVKISEKLSCI